MRTSNTPHIVASSFGALADGRPVELFTLRSPRGMEVAISTYGGTLVRLTAPDRGGRYEDVVLGYDALRGYLHAGPYFGALIGRYANRIAGAQFVLDGKTYDLARNDGANSLHGGGRGFDKVLWQVAESSARDDGLRLQLTYISPDGEEGYPGELAVSATYTLAEDDSLRLEFAARTDQKTVVNLTQHSYFNLRGAAEPGDVLGHVATIHAGHYLPVDAGLIPTGERRPVAGTAFDFREGRRIGARIGDPDVQLVYGQGYDHTLILDTPPAVLAHNASVFEPTSGRVLEVSSTQPALQFYTGNLLDGSRTGKQGRRYPRHAGFCLEPQHFPDSPHHADFPSTVLEPGDTYRQTMVFRFGTR